MGQYLVTFGYIQGAYLISISYWSCIFVRYGLMEFVWIWKEEGGHLQEQNCSLVITAEGLKSFCGRKLCACGTGVWALYMMRGGMKLWGWRIPSASPSPAVGSGGFQQDCYGCLLSSNFHTSCHSSQLSSPELLSPPEDFSSWTFQFSHRLSDSKWLKSINLRF